MITVQAARGLAELRAGLDIGAPWHQRSIPEVATHAGPQPGCPRRDKVEAELEAEVQACVQHLIDLMSEPSVKGENGINRIECWV